MQNPDFAELRQRWQALAEALAVAPTLAEPVFEALVTGYSADGRAYHNLTHIQQMLRHIDPIMHRAQDGTAVQLAIWFHDVVYEPAAADNEAQSAACARRVLADWGLVPKRLDRIAQMILATRLDSQATPDADTAMLLDADLATLGSHPDEYARYVRAIRQEFAFVPEADYRAGRTAVLAQFLTRPRIYLTSYFYERLERQARQNIRRELAALQASEQAG